MRTACTSANTTVFVSIVADNTDDADDGRDDVASGDDNNYGVLKAVTMMLMNLLFAVMS